MTDEKQIEKKAKKERKSKATEPVQKPVFPATEFVNPWGFIRLSRNVLEAFGVNHTSDVKKPYEKTNVTINLQEGALVIKRA